MISAEGPLGNPFPSAVVEDERSPGSPESCSVNFLSSSSLKPEMGLLPGIKQELKTDDPFQDNIFDTGSDFKNSIFSGAADLPREGMAPMTAEQRFQNNVLNASNGNKDGCFTVTSHPLRIVSTKKKRQRRNPVWPYFDVNDGIASCKQCSYTTKSVFSTNLKVHLRTHHNATYKLVIEAEEQQHAALQKSLVACTHVRPSTAGTPFVHKVTTTALPADGNGHAAAAKGEHLSLGQILNRMCEASTHESRPPAQSVPGTPSAPATPLSSAGDAECSFDVPSTSDYDLTYSTLLNGGRIDEGCLPALNQSTSSSKRRRLRRHPVWRFFKDVDGTKSVGCVKCSFNTASPFSTNLKMHLKAHHKDDYTLVLRLEAQQREEEGIRENSLPFNNATVRRKISSEELQAEANSHLKKALCQPPPVKKPSLFDVNDEESMMSMSMSERLAAMVELAASNATDDGVADHSATGAQGAVAMMSQSQPSMPVAASSSSLDAIQNSLLARFGLSGSDLMQSSPLLQKNSLLSSAASLSASLLHSHGVSLVPSSASTTSTQDASKSVRTVSKKLPTGEVVKVRTMRKDAGAGPAASGLVVASPKEPLSGTAPPRPPSVLQTTVGDEFASRSLPMLSAYMRSEPLKQPATDARSSAGGPLSVSPPSATAVDGAATGGGAAALLSPVRGLLKPSDTRVARDESLARFMDKSKAFHLLGMPEFKNFVQTLAPDYQLPSSGSLKRLAETLK